MAILLSMFTHPQAFFRPVSLFGPPPAVSYLVQQDGSSKFLLQDGSSALILN